MLGQRRIGNALQTLSSNSTDRMLVGFARSISEVLTHLP